MTISRTTCAVAIDRLDDAGARRPTATARPASTGRPLMVLAGTVLAILVPLQAAAQSGDRGPALAFSLGAGVSSVPSYFGSDEVVAGPEVAFDFGGVRLGPIGFGGAGPEDVRDGLGFEGSFRYIPGRSADDYAELTGLEDVDATFELGGGVSYARPWWEAFAVARYGIGGSGAAVGEVGMDLIVSPIDRLTLRAGPRILIGSENYAATYFGVTADEAALSDFEAFEAGGGVMSAGLEVGATYQLTEAWGVEGNVRLERLRNDAADSPITTEDDQVTASLAITRRFNFGF